MVGGVGVDTRRHDTHGHDHLIKSHNGATIGYLGMN